MRGSENWQYEELMAAAVARLREREPGEIAARAGLELSGTDIAMDSFGQRLRVNAATFAIDPALEMWHVLCLLQYLASVDGSHPTDEWIALANLPEGGVSRGASFDREIDGLIAERLGKHAPEDIRGAFEALGATFREDSRADLCAEFRFAPNYPLLLNLWYADDEFPASGKVLVNGGVRRCLGLEAAGTAAVLLARRLCETVEA